jgi:pimeloyl-ACP methyl ester carboxylesterase
MDYWAKVLLIVGIVIICIFLFYVLFFVFIYSLIGVFFNKRQEGVPGLKYFTVKDFPDLSYIPIAFKSGKNTLNGAIYYKGELDYSRMIAFFHGFGSGHYAYMKEINRLINENNLPVITFDYTASGISEGKKVKGLTQYLIDAYYFFAYLKDEGKYRDTSFILIGHSMGGYVSGCIHTFVKDTFHIERLVLMAPVNSINETYLHYSVHSDFYLSYMEMRERGKFKQFANVTVLDSLKENHVPTLLFHGREDKVVIYEDQILPIVNYAQTVDYIRPVIYDNKGHQVYFTKRADDAFDRVFREIHKINKSKDKAKREAYYNAIDYDVISEDDPEVFNVIKSFIRDGAKQN